MIAANGRAGETDPTPPLVDHHPHIRSEAGAALLDLMSEVLEEERTGWRSSEQALYGRRCGGRFGRGGSGRGLVLSSAFQFGMPDLE